MPEHALNADGKLEKASDVERDPRESQHRKWRCPGCKRAMLHKNGVQRSKHFAHMPGETCAYEDEYEKAHFNSKFCSHWEAAANFKRSWLGKEIADMRTAGSLVLFRFALMSKNMVQKSEAAAAEAGLRLVCVLEMGKVRPVDRQPYYMQDADLVRWTDGKHYISLGGKNELEYFKRSTDVYLDGGYKQLLKLRWETPPGVMCDYHAVELVGWETIMRSVLGAGAATG
ncbi:hypothetical protein WJX72_007908 [[Myrmecia] bisecta]|uniref:Competence protein CoiA-like N-terminal domain-containing protein n=1 Tax=[Myrmecia] bisecta TaxID=41462 RepID=A0AAW1Q7I6_9CHLO